MNSPNLTILAYGEHHLVLIVDQPHDKHPSWAPTGSGRLGSVLRATSSDQLRVSEEALSRLGRIEVGTDSIGDVDWFAAGGDGQERVYAFGWYGPITRIVDVRDAVAARGFRVYRDFCRIVPNAFPDGVESKAADAIARGFTCWDIKNAKTPPFSDEEVSAIVNEENASN